MKKGVHTEVIVLKCMYIASVVINDPKNPSNNRVTVNAMVATKISLLNLLFIIFSPHIVQL
ncbi:MAG: hypothetical protein KatS3mg080_0806 [Anoxybacillus sp.]|nr:MAG: hypothetical protein KatS3mg080_0806 [Anoxybacillus sp.]